MWPVPVRLLLVLMGGVAATAVSGGCSGGNDDSPDDDAVSVVATIAPVAALVEAVGGETIELYVLVGAGVDPHDYEVSADDRKAIEDADVVFRNGAGIDDFLDEAIDEDDEKVVTLTQDLALRGPSEDEHGEGEDEHDPDGVDPHAWHDVGFDKEMLAAIVERLEAESPENGGAYRANAEAYGVVLDEADAEIRALIEEIPPENRKMVTNHDAFGYFIDRYGLEFVGAVIPSLTTAAEPSAGDIAELVDTIEREDVKAIFAESSVDPKVAEQVANDTGAAIVDDLYGDSLGEPGSGAETIHGMLLANARAIAEALK